MSTIIATIHHDLEWWKRKVTDMIHAKEPAAVYVVGHAEHILEALQLLEEIGYDAMRVALRALVEARSVDVAEFRRYLRIGLQEFDGVTGTIAFDERGDVRRYPTMHTIWNERVVSCAWLAEQKKRKLRELLEGITPSRVQAPALFLRLEV